MLRLLGQIYIYALLGRRIIVRDEGSACPSPYFSFLHENSGRKEALKAANSVSNGG